MGPGGTRVVYWKDRGGQRGIVTLIGTSTNVVVTAASARVTARPVTFGGFPRYGLPIDTLRLAV